MNQWQKSTLDHTFYPYIISCQFFYSNQGPSSWKIKLPNSTKNFEVLGKNWWKPLWVWTKQCSKTIATSGKILTHLVGKTLFIGLTTFCLTRSAIFKFFSVLICLPLLNFRVNATIQGRHREVYKKMQPGRWSPAVVTITPDCHKIIKFDKPWYEQNAQKHSSVSRN